MSETTTTYTDLARIRPQSETHWRAIAARAHRIRSEAGDEAAARTHENLIEEIRSGHSSGSSRLLRFCPRCLSRGHRYPLIYVGGVDRCGTCDWAGPDRE